MEIVFYLKFELWKHDLMFILYDVFKKCKNCKFEMKEKREREDDCKLVWHDYKKDAGNMQNSSRVVCRRGFRLKPSMTGNSAVG